MPIKHDTSQRLSCSVAGCQYEAKDNGTLKRHERSHLIPSIPCPIAGCNRIFKDKNSETYRGHRDAKHIKCPVKKDCGWQGVSSDIRYHELAHPENASLLAPCSTPGCFMYHDRKSPATLTHRSCTVTGCVVKLPPAGIKDHIDAGPHIHDQAHVMKWREFVRLEGEGTGAIDGGRGLQSRARMMEWLQQKNPGQRSESLVNLTTYLAQHRLDCAKLASEIGLEQLPSHLLAVLYPIPKLHDVRKGGDLPFGPQDCYLNPEFSPSPLPSSPSLPPTTDTFRYGNSTQLAKEVEHYDKLCQKFQKLTDLSNLEFRAVLHRNDPRCLVRHCLAILVAADHPDHPVLFDPFESFIAASKRFPPLGPEEHFELSALSPLSTVERHKPIENTKVAEASLHQLCDILNIRIPELVYWLAVPELIPNTPNRWSRMEAFLPLLCAVIRFRTSKEQSAERDVPWPSPSLIRNQGFTTFNIWRTLDDNLDQILGMSRANTETKLNKSTRASAVAAIDAYLGSKNYQQLLTTLNSDVSGTWRMFAKVYASLYAPLMQQTDAEVDLAPACHAFTGTIRTLIPDLTKKEEVDGFEHKQMYTSLFREEDLILLDLVYIVFGTFEGFIPSLSHVLRFCTRGAAHFAALERTPRSLQAFLDTHNLKEQYEGLISDPTLAAVALQLED
ncbi:uncharacterized protein I303_102210 [Kwoniella dejecticola CBS 10117]|uniref:C2H2-type domain-containing protein n=1 Tax=Kwoniella dejecticola CBS 10117 TaxID=1296121 RepID=A0A1A6ABL2_9TREE|nr:uncharacterized protein I303_01649 [Kwoniella dejecticola CBS 10117]OBR87444.1 hypothetical protein I303_01649 [Kwoniella dejecticola CBS 10117]